uniref:Uncharacterized protein n=1 Tax=Tanacetum cinerariifolium TaxID=118510 RepID=A0A6L2K9S3_TANCI|nr:hypothetical protein [Tanacetum cinerariifolium]
MGHWRKHLQVNCPTKLQEALDEEDILAEQILIALLIGADMKKCVHLKSVRDELLRSFAKKIVWTAKAQKKVWSAEENEELQPHAMVHSQQHVPSAATAAIVSAVCQANDHGLKEYGYQSRIGIRVPKKWRSFYFGIEFYELMIDLQSIRDPESVYF